VVPGFNKDLCLCLVLVRNVNPCGLQRQNIEPITRGNRLLQQCWWYHIDRWLQCTFSSGYEPHGLTIKQWLLPWYGAIFTVYVMVKCISKMPI